MRTTTGAAHASHSSLVSNQERGQAIKERRLALEIKTPSAFAVATGRDPQTIRRIEEGRASNSTYDAMELWLTRQEAARQEGASEDAPGPSAEPIRIEMHGVYGIDQIIVTGPVDRPDELAETIGKVMDRIRAQAEGGQ